jgi:acetyl-CoA carboxylase biotin carboxyl carrier protein
MQFWLADWGFHLRRVCLTQKSSTLSPETSSGGSKTMSDTDRPEPTGAAPARESQREGGAQQSQPGTDQSRMNSQNTGGRRGMRRRHGGREGQPQQQSSHTQRSDISINMDELRELFSLIASQGFTEFELEKEGFHVRLRRDFVSHVTTGAPGTPPPQAHSTSFAPTPQPTAQTQSSAEPAQTTAQAAGGAKPKDSAPDVELHTITSPIVGTFYRSPSPTAESFVKVGSHVAPDSVVCIVEAMKLMNEILAETTGTVEKIYVENGQPVEYGQPLFGVKK